MSQYKKVAHLTSVHRRSDTRIFFKECLSLAKHGYEVSLIVADGLGDTTINDINIIDAGASNGRFDRIRNAANRVLREALKLNAEIYHFHDPELINIGLKLKAAGKVVIFDIHENTDLQILTKEWIPHYLRLPVSWLYRNYENFACKKFDALIVPQVSMKKKFEKYGRTELIANFPTNLVNQLECKNLSKFNLLYSGSLSRARGLYNMLDLIDVLANIDSRYKLTLAGPISEDDYSQAKAHPGWRNTVYLGLLDKKSIFSEYKNNSIGLILFNNVGQYYMAYALKLFEYMQCGMTVIMPDFGDWLEFNNEFNVGFNVDPKSSQEIAMKISSLSTKELQDFSVHNHKCSIEHFLWSTQEDKLISLYGDLLKA